MTLRVLGAGLGRTGTLSLKVALERLLGGRCYHMVELFSRPQDIGLWHEAVHGSLPDWDELLGDYCAAVDEPPAAFWRELAEAYPDCLVVLSLRDPMAWWESADETAFGVLRSDPPAAPPFMAAWHTMVRDMMDARFPGMLDDRDTAIATFERHNALVREVIPAGRLLEWRAEQGWAPLCDALRVPVPSEPFPHVNTRAEWKARQATT